MSIRKRSKKTHRQRKRSRRVLVTFKLSSEVREYIHSFAMKRNLKFEKAFEILLREGLKLLNKRDEALKVTKVSQYKIPEKYKKLIDLEFIRNFKASMQDTFCIPPDGTTTEWSRYALRLGSVGWYGALIDTFELLELTELQEYHDTIGLDDQEMFDNELMDIAVSYGLLKEPTQEEKDNYL